MPSPPPQFATHADPLDPAALTAAGIATLVHLHEVDSTMTAARRLAADPAAALPALVIAERQTAGRGRRGAGWWQADASLAASIVIDGPLVGAAGPRPTWSLACGVALAETIRSLEPAVDATVRWPNDVEVSGRKLAGIILETVPPNRGIIGVGVNSAGTAAGAPAGLRERVVTLPDLIGRTLPRSRLVATLVPRLLGLLADIERDPAALVARYAPLCGLTGRHVTVHVGDASHQGLCRGIAADGRLVLETAAGTTTFASGSLTPPGAAWPGPG